MGVHPGICPTTLGPKVSPVSGHSLSIYSNACLIPEITFMPQDLCRYYCKTESTQKEITQAGQRAQGIMLPESSQPDSLLECPITVVTVPFPLTCPRIS